ncbi:MAG: nucleotide exchange factor GrpE [Alphaproteobacteria bacterium]|nr:nucleotide exchange factor GrpE [Alphaproteobacteria bacterium]
MTQTSPEPVPPQEMAEEAAEPTREAVLEQEVAQMKDQVLRALAEAENARKRAQRDVEETAKYANAGFAKDLVNIAENLTRASTSITQEMREADARLKTLAEGVDRPLRELLSVFERHGIRRLDPAGEKFDHQFHQAVAQVDMPDSPPGHVVQVYQAGYVIHDRLLRPAMVTVSRQPAQKTASSVDTSA